MIPSVRNAEAGHLHVLENANCKKIFHSEEYAKLATSLQTKKIDLETFTVPALDPLIDATPKHFAYNKRWESSWKEPVIIAHSSGSTGIPKPITMTHGSFSILDNERNLHRVPGRKNRDFSIWDFSGGGRFYHIFPYFHQHRFIRGSESNGFQYIASLSIPLKHRIIDHISKICAEISITPDRVTRMSSPNVCQFIATI